MRRLRALDLFCGAGGASMGLHRAGFDVTGVDLHPQPRYPFQFAQADAMTFDLEGFDFIWASPPCQRYTVALHCRLPMYRDRHPDLVAPVRKRLKASGAYYVIENVPGAPLETDFYLCGQMFGLKLFRHRLFEANFPLTMPVHAQHNRGATCRGEVFSVFGGGGGGRRTFKRANGEVVSFSRGSQAQWADAMQIDWMGRGELSQAIPPAYSEFIARQFLGLETKARAA